MSTNHESLVLSLCGGGDGDSGGGSGGGGGERRDKECSVGDYRYGEYQVIKARL